MRDAAEVEKISRHSLVEWDDIVHASSSERTLLDHMLEMEVLYTNGMSYNKAVALYKLSAFSRAGITDEAKRAKLMKVAISTNATPDEINRAIQGDGFLSEPKYVKDNGGPLVRTILKTATEFIDKKIKGITQELLAYKKNYPSRIGDAESFWDAIKTKHQDPVILQRLEAALVKLGVFYQIEQASLQQYIFESEQYDVLLYKHQPPLYASILLKLWGQKNIDTARFKIAHLEAQPTYQNQKSIQEPTNILLQITQILSSWTKVLIHFDKILPTQQDDAASAVLEPSNVPDTHVEYIGLKGIVGNMDDKRVVVPLSVRTSLEAFDAYNTSEGLGYMMYQLDLAESVDYVVVNRAHLWLEAQFTLLELALMDTADETLNSILSYIAEASLEQMFNDFNASAQPTLSAADDRVQSHVRAFINQTIQTNQQHAENWHARFRDSVVATTTQQTSRQQVSLSESFPTYTSVEAVYYTQRLLAEKRNAQLTEARKVVFIADSMATTQLFENYSNKLTDYDSWSSIKSNAESVLYELKNLQTEALLIFLYFFNNRTFFNHFDDVEKNFILDRETEMEAELWNRVLQNPEDKQAFIALLADLDVKNDIIILKRSLEHTQFNEGNKLTNFFAFITPRMMTELKNALQVEKISRYSLVEWDDIVHASSSERTLLDHMLEMELLYTNGMSYNKAVALYKLSAFSRAGITDEAKRAKLMKVAISTNATPDEINRAIQGDGFLSEPKYVKDNGGPLVRTILVTATEFIDEKIKGITQELLAYKKNYPSRIGDAESFWDAIKTKHQDPVILQRLEAALVKLGVFYQIEQASLQQYIFESEQYDVLLYKHQPPLYASILLKLWGQKNIDTARFKIAHLEVQPIYQNQKSIKKLNNIREQILQILVSWNKMNIHFDKILPAQQDDAASAVLEPSNVPDTHVEYIGLKGIVGNMDDKRVVVPLSVRTSLEAFDAYNTGEGLGYMMYQLDLAESVDYVVVNRAHLWLEAQFTLLELALMDTADETLNSILSYIAEASLEQMFNDFNASAQPTLSAADDRVQSHVRVFINQTIQTNQQHAENWHARFRDSVVATTTQQTSRQQVSLSESFPTYTSVEAIYYTQRLLAEKRNAQLTEARKVVLSTVDTITRSLTANYHKFADYESWSSIKSNAESVLYELKNLQTEALLIFLYFFNNHTFFNHFDDVEKNFILDRETEMEAELWNRVLQNSEDRQAFIALLADLDVKNDIIILKRSLEHAQFNEGNKFTNFLGFITPRIFTKLKGPLQTDVQSPPIESDIETLTPGAHGLFGGASQEEQEDQQAFTAILADLDVRKDIKRLLERIQLNWDKKFTNIFQFIKPHIITVLKGALQRVVQPSPIASQEEQEDRQASTITSDVEVRSPRAHGLFGGASQDQQEPQDRQASTITSDVEVRSPRAHGLFGGASQDQQAFAALLEDLDVKSDTLLLRGLLEQIQFNEDYKLYKP